MIDIQDILVKIEKLPPMPEVAGKILKISSDPTVSAQDIIDIVKYDQNVTANILRVCNSSFYSLQRKISSLNEAAVLLGNVNLFNIILTSISRNLLGKENKGYEMEKGILWEHSVSCAILAKEIANRVNFNDEQLSYSTGLMHDSGKVILDGFLQNKTKEILEEVMEEKTEFDVIEKNLIGFDHAEVGAKLAEVWKFPQPIIDGIRYHHNPDDATENLTLVYIVHLADALSVMFGFGGGIDGLNYHISSKVTDALKISEADIYSLSPFLVTEIKKASDMISS